MIHDSRRSRTGFRSPSSLAALLACRHHLPRSANPFRTVKTTLSTTASWKKLEDKEKAEEKAPPAVKPAEPDAKAPSKPAEPDAKAPSKPGEPDVQGSVEAVPPAHPSRAKSPAKIRTSTACSKSSEPDQEDEHGSRRSHSHGGMPKPGDDATYALLGNPAMRRRRPRNLRAAIKTSTSNLEELTGKRTQEEN